MFLGRQDWSCFRPKSSSTLRSPLLFPSHHGSWPEMFLAKGTDVSGISADPLPFETCSTNQTSNDPTKKNVVKRKKCLPLGGEIFWMALEKTLKKRDPERISLKSIEWPLLHPNLYISTSRQFSAQRSTTHGCFCQAASFGPFRCHRSPAFRHLWTNPKKVLPSCRHIVANWEYIEFHRLPL